MLYSRYSKFSAEMNGLLTNRRLYSVYWQSRAVSITPETFKSGSIADSEDHLLITCYLGEVEITILPADSNTPLPVFRSLR